MDLNTHTQKQKQIKDLNDIYSLFETLGIINHIHQTIVETSKQFLNKIKPILWQTSVIPKMNKNWFYVIVVHNAKPELLMYWINIKAVVIKAGRHAYPWISLFQLVFRLVGMCKFPEWSGWGRYMQRMSCILSHFSAILRKQNGKLTFAVL